MRGRSTSRLVRERDADAVLAVTVRSYAAFAVHVRAVTVRSYAALPRQRHGQGVVDIPKSSKVGK